LLVYLNNYKHHWISPYTILEKIYFWREIDYDEPMIEKLSSVLHPICVAIRWVLDKLDRKIDYVKIDRWDTWSMDITLSHIILPMLKQLQATKHGAPSVDDEDVPEYLKSYMAQPKEYEWDTDELWFKRWDWVLNEMIWTFEQKIDDDNDAEFFDHSTVKGLPWDKDYIGPKMNVVAYESHQARISNGFRLFGKYYQALWD
jgi:hypothetical protein